MLRAFVRDGRLLAFPSQQSKRRIVLEHIACSFEPGRRHTERDLTAVLAAWCEGGKADHVTLRRYLVDEGLLSRADGVYWRSGGSLDDLAG
ncbi:DUF2087 domain-containing protein [Solihabitans fulvus]|uniref:DUF2087 domain-containing protein n=1 Tax=Solihabitans fulvus TaxID=1892852 RepID=UPI001CB76801|nr:DUF2087 domain-containing protein [Solihabitans fulvus]